MRLFGGYLPFIGFRDEPIPDDETAEFFGLPPGTRCMETFQIEWLHNGLVIAVRPKNVGRE